ncbi:MAG TPA: anthranilate phosphoribosyltransferase [Bryobacteraceae bacterium]|nr:anthranilate phosphoribosyltransferase [Bryobacteraceae bacterium]
MSFVSYLHRVLNRENLSEADAQAAMELILRGEATTPLIAAFLVALRMKGESADELVGFARAMLINGRQIRVRTEKPLVDTCGTGGDGLQTINISTISAFVIAGAGVRVAKHGNRSLSSLCGSADIFEELGVHIDLEPSCAALLIESVGMAFFFAPRVHPAMRHAQAARQELKMRTAFNLLGPLTNPAGATVQLVGAASVRSAELLAKSLASLGLQRGFVVHGFDGLDEISISGETLLFEIQRGAIADRTVTPADFGVNAAPLSEIRGGERKENAEIALSILSGERGPKRDIVLMNAAAALVAAGKATNFYDAMALAAESIDSGAAKAKLRELAQASHSVTDTPVK